MLTLVLQFLLKERLLSQIPMQTLVYAKVSKNIAYANFSTPNGLFTWSEVQIFLQNVQL